MLIRLIADQTDFFGLSGADFFFVLLFQLVLVRLVALGNARRLASCAWHVMSNAKKKRGGWDEKELFWPYQQALTLETRDAKWNSANNAVNRFLRRYLLHAHALTSLYRHVRCHIRRERRSNFPRI